MLQIQTDVEKTAIRAPWHEFLSAPSTGCCCFVGWLDWRKIQAESLDTDQGREEGMERQLKAFWCMDSPGSCRPGTAVEEFRLAILPSVMEAGGQFEGSDVRRSGGVCETRAL